MSKSRIRTDKTPVHVVLIDHNVYPFIIGLHGKDLLPKCMTAISVIDKMFIKKYWLLSLPCKYLVSIMIHFVYKGCYWREGVTKMCMVVNLQILV